MARPAKPWYWKARDGWYVTIEGHRYPLAKGKDARAEATRAFHVLMAQGGLAPPPRVVDAMTCRDVADLYYVHAQANLAPLTAEWYGRHLKSFVKALGATPADQLRPRDVVAWVDATGWGPSTRNGAITAAKRAFAWAARHGHIAADPIAATEKPRARRRSRIMTDDQARTVIDSVPDPEFRDYLVAMRETGARPSEVAKVEAKDFVPGVAAWVFATKTTAATGKLRVIHLNGPMVEMTVRLSASHPEGPIFRNTRGNPWTRNALACRFADIRTALGLGPEATAESFRHRFITDALARGISSAIVAEMAGHQSTAMISRHYSHLGDEHAAIKEALERVRSGKPPVRDA